MPNGQKTPNAPDRDERPDDRVTPEQKAPNVLPLEAQIRSFDLEIDGAIDAAKAPGADDPGFLRKEAS